MPFCMNEDPSALAYMKSQAEVFGSMQMFDDNQPIDLSLKTLRKNNENGYFHRALNNPLHNTIYTPEENYSFSTDCNTIIPHGYGPQSIPYKFTCCHCLYQSSNLTDMNGHIREKHSDQKPALPDACTYFCDHCDFKAYAFFCMLKHVLLCHTDIVFPVDSTSDLNSKIFVCPHCAYQSLQQSMALHILEHHRNMEVCGDCVSCTHSQNNKKDFNSILPVVRKNRSYVTKAERTKKKLADGIGESGSKDHSIKVCSKELLDGAITDFVVDIQHNQPIKSNSIAESDTAIIQNGLLEEPLESAHEMNNNLHPTSSGTLQSTGTIGDCPRKISHSPVYQYSPLSDTPALSEVRAPVVLLNDNNTASASLSVEVKGDAPFSKVIDIELYKLDDKNHSENKDLDSKETTNMAENGNYGPERCKAMAAMLRNRLSQVCLKQKLPRLQHLKNQDGEKVLQHDLVCQESNSITPAKGIMLNADKRLIEVPMKRVLHTHRKRKRKEAIEDGGGVGGGDNLKKQTPIDGVGSHDNDCKVTLIRIGEGQYFIKRVSKRDSDCQSKTSTDSQVLLASDSSVQISLSAANILPSPVETSSDDCSLGDLCNESLVVCPFCPKQLLYRLLPAHVMYHQNEGEFKCNLCNFSCNFKWVLNEHSLCHRTRSSVIARKISLKQWETIEPKLLGKSVIANNAQRLLAKKCPQRESKAELMIKKPGKTGKGITKIDYQSCDSHIIDFSKAITIEEFIDNMLSTNSK